MPLIMNTMQTNNYERMCRTIIRAITVAVTISLCHNITIDGPHKRDPIYAMSCYSARLAN